MIKVNFDAGVIEGGRWAGIGAVARNDKGEIMVALSEKINFCPDSDFLEATAAMKGVTMAKEIGLKRIHLEVDSLRVVMELRNPSHDLSCFGDLIVAIRYLHRSLKFGR